MGQEARSSCAPGHAEDRGSPWPWGLPCCVRWAIFVSPPIAAAGDPAGLPPPGLLRSISRAASAQQVPSVGQNALACDPTRPANSSPTRWPLTADVAQGAAVCGSEDVSQGGAGGMASGWRSRRTESRAQALSPSTPQLVSLRPQDPLLPTGDSRVAPSSGLGAWRALAQRVRGQAP